MSKLAPAWCAPRTDAVPVASKHTAKAPPIPFLKIPLFISHSSKCCVDRRRHCSDAIPHIVLALACTFFLAVCHEASRGANNGYAGPGWHLAGALGSQVPYDIAL